MNAFWTVFGAGALLVIIHLAADFFGVSTFDVRTIVCGIGLMAVYLTFAIYRKGK